MCMCRTPEDVEDVKREVQIMHHLAGHPNITLLKGSYEDRSNVHLVITWRTGPSMSLFIFMMHGSRSV